MLAAGAIQVAMRDGEANALLSHPVLGEMLKLWTLEDEGVPPLLHLSCLPLHPLSDLLPLDVSLSPALPCPALTPLSVPRSLQMTLTSNQLLTSPSCLLDPSFCAPLSHH